MNGKRRVRLSYAQKQAIVAEWQSRSDAGSIVDVSKVGDWARRKFNLSSSPSKSAIYGIIQQRNWVPVGATPCYGARMRSSSVRSFAVEQGLIEWTWDCYERKTSVGGDIIKMKGKALLSLVNDRLPPEKRIKVEFSNGWLHQFQQRNKFKAYRSLGEGVDTDEGPAKQAISVLYQKLRQYATSDVWNADEFGLFYRMAPNITSGPARLRGKNKRKDRITFLAACNADGSEKMPLLAVDTSKEPRCFEGKTAEELQLEYRATEKGWMNKELFFEWLVSFDSHISLKKDRKVALVIDNASCHGLITNLPTLKSVEVIFLPKRTTSKIRPLDAGVITFMKNRFRKRQLQRALTLDKTTDNTDLYEMEVLTAITWMYEVWKDVTCKTVHNSWAKTGLLSNCNAIAVDENELESNIVEDVHFNAVFDGEDDCVGMIDDTDLVNHIIGQGE